MDAYKYINQLTHYSIQRRLLENKWIHECVIKKNNIDYNVSILYQKRMELALISD